MMFDPVATAVPVAGEVWDLVTIIGLIYFWYTFFNQLPSMRAAWGNSSNPSTKGGFTLQFKTSAINNMRRKRASTQRLGLVGGPAYHPR
jgi:hypothetical protein